MGINVSSLFESNHHHVVLLGLDYAGKTTILYRLKGQKMVDPTPTVGFNCGKFRVSQGTARGHSFTVWDVGGQECFRMLWPTYLKNAVAMVFVIDASEPKRFEEAKVELDAALLTISSQTKLPVIIIANKQDKPGALDAEQTLAKFSKTPNNQEIFRVLPCCAVTGEGVENIFSEVLSAIQALKK